jgi:hypothetical protein
MFFFQLFVDVEGCLPHSSMTKVFIERILEHQEDLIVPFQSKYLQKDLLKNVIGLGFKYHKEL